MLLPKCVCLRGSAPDRTSPGGFQRPLAGKHWVSPLQRAPQMCGPQGPETPRSATGIDCELSTETCSKNVYSLGPLTFLTRVTSTINPVWLITEQSNLRFTIPRIRQPISSASLTPDSRSIPPRIQTILRLDSNFAVSKRFAFCCEIAKAILLDGLLTHLLVLRIGVAV